MAGNDEFTGRSESQRNPNLKLKNIRSFSDAYSWMQQNAQRASIIGASLLTGIPTVINSGYRVPLGHEGVIQTGGLHTSTQEEGFHFKLPYFQSVTKVDVATVRTEEFGYRTIKSDVRSDVLGIDGNGSLSIHDEKVLEEIVQEQRTFGYPVEGKSLEEQVKKLLQAEYLHITGDLNMVDIEDAVQWRIANSADFLFNVENPRKLLRDVREWAVNVAVGDYSVDEVITISRAEIEEKVKLRMQERLDSLHSGIGIVTYKPQGVNPPRAVQPSYNEVSQAKKQKDTAVNTAWQQYNKVIPESDGKANQILRQAEADSTEMVNLAMKEILEFRQLREAAERNPEITNTRLYLDAWQSILANPNANVRGFEQKAAEGGILLKLDIK